MENLKNFSEFISEELNEKSIDVMSTLYSALENVEFFKQLGADQQGELIKIISKKLATWGIK